MTTNRKLNTEVLKALELTLLLAEKLRSEEVRENYYQGNYVSHICGFSACAAGWAVTMPEFKKAGLHFSRYSYSKALTVVYRNFTGTSAMTNLLKMSFENARTIFGAFHITGDNDNPIPVAEALETHAKELERELYKEVA